MRLRLSGTEAECAAAVAALAAGFVVREVSGFYPNRGASQLGRVYVDAVPHSPAAGRVRGHATPVEEPPTALPAGGGGRVLPPGGAS